MKFVQAAPSRKSSRNTTRPRRTAGSHEVEQFRLLQMFLSLCQTVAYAHNRGVLHRDLKPENVMLGSFGETILLDWGIAKVMGQPEQASGGDGPRTCIAGRRRRHRDPCGRDHGHASYMAPEVAAGLNDEVDYRSDMYLLGATLYEMLTGRQPRTAKTVMEMIKKAKYEPPVSARKINPLVPKGSTPSASRRWPTTSRTVTRARGNWPRTSSGFVAGEPVSAFPESFATRAWRWAKRHRTALLRSAAAVLIVSGALFATAKVANRRRARPSA